jgi:hypothetical protein
MAEHKFNAGDEVWYQAQKALVQGYELNRQGIMCSGRMPLEIVVISLKSQGFTMKVCEESLSLIEEIV